MSTFAPRSTIGKFTPNKETAAQSAPSKRGALLSSALADFIQKEQARRHDPKKQGESSFQGAQRYAAVKVQEGGPNKGSPVGGPSMPKPKVRKKGSGKGASATPAPQTKMKC